MTRSSPSCALDSCSCLQAIEDACSHGVSRLDLGGGRDDYKLRFADGDDPLVVVWPIPQATAAVAPLARAAPPAELSWLARRVAKRLLR